IDRAPRGIDADAEIIEHEVVDVLLDLPGPVGAGREDVVIGDQEEALVLLLQPQAVLQRSHIVAQVELAGRAVSGEEAPPSLAPGGPRLGPDLRVGDCHNPSSHYRPMPRSSRTRAAGSGARISAVPTRTACIPSRSISSTWERASIPLSATTVTPSGRRGRSVRAGSSVTSSVSRFRL